MAKDALVSEDLARKFATEKETPYTRWVRAEGLEFEAQMRIRGGVRGQVSYALQQATDQDTQQALTNSPRHMLKTRVSVDGPTPHSSIALELLYLSSRTTLADNTLPASALSGTVEVRGRYQRFDVDPATLSVYDFVFTTARKRGSDMP